MSSKVEVCKTCNGTGIEYDGAGHTCTACNGIVAPVVERQPVAVLQVAARMETTKEAWFDVAKETFDEYVGRGDPWMGRTLYTAPPDLAELQATIARLTAEVEQLRGGQRDDYSELKRLAESATAGLWVAAGPSFGSDSPQYMEEVLVDREGDEDDTYTVCQATTGLEKESSHDMEFIAAANPANVLALIAEIERLKGGQGEPVALLMLGDIFYGTDGPEVDDWDIQYYHKACEKLAQSRPGEQVALYTSQPAPVAVVLPERILGQFHDDPIAEGQAYGWNTCLDKVKELNQ
jgi:hypothetical protein